MSKIYNYDDFINEEFFKKIFGKPKKKTISKVESAIKEIIIFLKENGIYDWNDFISTRNVDRKIIDTIIDHSASNMSELKDIRFGVRLELSDSRQLREWLKELESQEEYEKCALVVKKLSNK